MKAALPAIVLATALQAAVVSAGNSPAPVLQSSPDDVYWTDRFTKPGLSQAWSDEQCFEVFANQLYIGGGFSEFDGAPVEKLIRWDGTTWSTVSGGVSNGPVSLPDDYSAVWNMVVYQNQLIVAGSFDHAGGVPAQNVAAWNGSTWAPLGAGLPTDVSTVAVIDGVLHASTYNGIREWVGGNWVSVGTNLTGGVSALVKVGPDLFAVGSFDVNSSHSNVARWNGTSWISVATTFWGHATDAAVYNGELVISGWFSQINGIAADGVARWNGTTWGPLAGGIPDTFVEGLAVHGNRLIALGWFLDYSGGYQNSIAQWDGVSWSAIGTGLNPDAYCSDAVTFNGDLCVVGDIHRAGNVGAWDLARWDGAEWHTMRPMDRLSVGGVVIALTDWQNDLVAAGDFEAAGDVAALNVARLADDHWEPLGSGLNNEAYAVAANGTDLIVGGYFSTAGGNPASRISRWDGSAWYPMGAGFNAPVWAVLPWQGGILAAGEFTMSGATPLNRIAFWDGASWLPLGSGMNGQVRALTLHQGEVVAGGGFSQAGGNAAAGIARWDGNAWHPMGTGVSGTVYALQSTGTDLVASGYFALAQGQPLRSIARWDGIQWNTMGFLGGGLYWGSIGWDLTVHDGQLVVGGAFSSDGGALSIARWNGTNWIPFGSGVKPPDNAGLPGPSNQVSAVHSFEGSLFLGGAFEEVGGKRVRGMAEWHGPTVTGVPEDPRPDRPTLQVAGSPNPFHRTTEIAWRMPEASRVHVEIHDIAGRRLITLLDEIQTGGSHHVTWDGTLEDGNVAARGIYFARVETGGKSKSVRLTFLRD